MLAVSAWLEKRWALFFASIGWIVITYNLMYTYFLPRKILVDSTMVGNHPIWNVVKTLYMFKFSKILGDFLKAWVDPIKSLEQMAKIFENYMYKKKTQDIKNDLAAWFTFAEAIEESPLFDPILTQIIIVWEQTGNLWEILVTMAGFYKDDLMQKIDTAMWFIEPILMVMVAWVIGCIVASIFLPLADLVNVIGG
jgi:type IV pilus assembly protein PilC